MFQNIKELIISQDLLLYSFSLSPQIEMWIFNFIISLYSPKPQFLNLQPYISPLIIFMLLSLFYYYYFQFLVLNFTNQILTAKANMFSSTHWYLISIHYLMLLDRTVLKICFLIDLLILLSLFFFFYRLHAALIIRSSSSILSN